ncbi:cytochrome b5 reductase 4 isoform X6 [Phycodurus eques]|uniref:cytochrome b5 reductase 4 isoform X6 n=1 Tax=Phycodurus eques TaxID=693459 RepID=UPI002ACE4F69|nr:cytochrome b5 reductase 4 isoform X6 [Phycodurus eques]
MLNIPTQSFPSPSSQQRVARPGQSGRAKVALKPGHSLMDWIRFSKSGKDLTGLRGRRIEVTQEELQKHNTRNDCWTCIRGMVYNVTPYMDYHPGGEDELMKAAGIDGTDLFDQVHRWVNYESMLKECLVGRMATKPTTAMKALFFRDCVLVSKTEVNHNTCVFQLQLPRGTIMHVPVGRHIYLKSLVQDIEVVRPYTPVDQSLSIGPNPSEKTNLYLMIKVYPDGVLTQHLNSLYIGDHVSVSGPEGTFSLRPLRDTAVLYLLAAGTGFTPMCRLIQLALQEITTIRKTQLLFFNRREEDIVWRRELDELTANDERFQVEHILSEPCDNWTGRKGRVDDAVIKDFLSRPDGSKCYVCVCGPPLFTEQTIRFRESGEITACKRQGRKPTLNARDLRSLRRHCIKNRHQCVKDITNGLRNTSENQRKLQNPASVLVPMAWVTYTSAKAPLMLKGSYRF